MAKVKSYINPNIPKPKPGSDTGKEPRYKTQPVKPVKPVKPKPDRPGINPPRKPKPGKPKPGRGIRNPIGKKPGRTLIDELSDFAKKQRQLPTRVKPEGKRRKKTGPQPSKRNDMIRNRLRPVGSN
jgi:hypothetical protein